MTSPRILTLTALSAAALAVPAGAVAADGLKFDAAPFLVETSNGAYVNYELTKTARTSIVTIDGRRARVKLVDAATREYMALVTRPSLRQGRRYTVTVKVTARDGSKLSSTRRLVLHRGGSSRESS
jgi:hypothetical protein